MFGSLQSRLPVHLTKHRRSGRFSTSAWLLATVVAFGVATSGSQLTLAGAPRQTLTPVAAHGRAIVENPVDKIDRDAEIRRDRYGVPHILAKTEEAAAFAHGYVTAEDHGAMLARLFLRAQGKMASVFGEGSIQSDLRTHVLGIYETASERFGDLPPFMQSILNGYAAGYDAYLERHRADFPAWAEPITGVDVLAHARAMLLLDFALDLSVVGMETRQAAGSNMWAIGRPLSKSGHGLLLANPHLGWEGPAIYHEVQLTVPGVINVSGVSLIGIPVVSIGFNEALGWSHTVNRIDSDDVYELTLDASGERYVYDGRALPLERRTVTIDVKSDGGIQPRTQTVFASHYGPVLRVDGSKAYAFKSANLADVNFLTQWNLMGKATSLRTFAAAVNMQQLPMFNLGYADREGNVWYVFNGRIPIRPSGYTWSGIVPGNTSKTEWFAVHPLSELPQLLNPKTGYIQNCNDAPWYANLEQPIDRAPFADYIVQDGLEWRSQTSLRILSGERELTLDKLKAYKYNSDVPFAERVKGDLITLLKGRDDEVSREAARVLEAWDNRADPDSRGAQLFLSWWNQYAKAAPRPFRTPWQPAYPLQTPRGLGDAARALELFDRTAAAMKRAYGALDVPYGDTHRLKRGNVDLPLGGSPLGIFQNVNYRIGPEQKFFAIGGDTYALAVEFAEDGPHAFSILTYSESSNPRSPHYSDQSALYASKQFKPAWFSEREIADNLKIQYRADR